MIYLIVFGISFVLTFFLKKIAVKKDFIDIPNHRSSHKIPTPTGGGSAIVISFYMGLLYFYFFENLPNQIFFTLLVGLPMIIVAKIDDIYDISPKFRFFVQVISVIVALYVFGTFSHNPWYISVLCFISLLWMINLYNFLDGIDGYAVSEAIFVSLGAYLFFPSPILLIIASASFGFLFFNWQRASIFMGDVGSVFLGYVFGIMALYTAQNIPDIIIWMSLFALFWLDASVTLLRRVFAKENILEPHRKHAYQRVTRAGLSHQKTVIYAMIINIISLAVLYVAYQKNFIYQFFVLYMIFLFFLLLYVEKRKAFND